MDRQSNNAGPDGIQPFYSQRCLFCSKPFLTSKSELSGSISASACEITQYEALVTINGNSADTSLTIALNTYVNPISTQGTEDYEILVYQSAADEASGNDLDSYTQNCSGGCSTLTPAAITATVSSDSVVVGEEEATFSFQFASTLSLVPGGYLTVTFPVIKTYSTEYPSLLTETSTCTALSGNLNKLTCELQTDGITMKISNTVSPATTGTFQFTISDVDNPYTTKPLSGFVLRNFHSDGGIIEADTNF